VGEPIFASSDRETFRVSVAEEGGKLKRRLRRIPLTTEGLSKRLAGRTVTEMNQETPSTMALRFGDGAVLVIEVAGDALRSTLRETASPSKDAASGARPTRRQLEYLEFIKRYLHRWARSPSEADIQKAFMVSAPSVHQMIRTLDRRGFISRDQDWLGQTAPRSIRVLWDG
jgi:hypothetical protein